jgi:hypothetical protein
MISRNCFWTMLGVCGALLAMAAPAATQAAEPSAQQVSATDTKIVCHRVKQPGSRTRQRQCATPAQWRAFRDMKIVCRWGKRPDAEHKEQFCATVAQWRVPATRPPGWISLNGRSPAGFSSDIYSPAVPGNANFGGSVASQSDFQR